MTRYAKSQSLPKPSQQLLIQKTVAFFMIVDSNRYSNYENIWKKSKPILVSVRYAFLYLLFISLSPYLLYLLYHLSLFYLITSFIFLSTLAFISVISFTIWSSSPSYLLTSFLYLFVYFSSDLFFFSSPSPAYLFNSLCPLSSYLLIFFIYLYFYLLLSLSLYLLICFVSYCLPISHISVASFFFIFISQLSHISLC